MTPLASRFVCACVRAFCVDSKDSITLKYVGEKKTECITAL